MHKRSHPLYGVWQQMWYRCYNPNSPRYRNYGARGITVCEQWRDLHDFAEWIGQNLGPCPRGHSIDRIDNDGNYEPGNVRWATPKMQSANKRPGGQRAGTGFSPKQGKYWPVECIAEAANPGAVAGH